MEIKFKMKDLACKHCADVIDNQCMYPVCPYIAENIHSLLDDPDFWTAVINAEKCRTEQDTMLVAIKAVVNCLLEQVKETTKRPRMVEAALQNLLDQPKHAPYKPRRNL